MEQLLAPHPLDWFLESVWERGFLHVRGVERGRQDFDLSGVMSLADVDSVLTRTYAAGMRRWDSVRLSKDGQVLSPDIFLRNRVNGFAEVDVSEILAQYAAGASVVLNNVHEAHPPAAALCSELSGFFGVGVHANVYLTPAGSRGLPLHFDGHDVFLLQLAGSKSWELFDAMIPLADSRHQSETYDAPREQPTRLSLEPGDLLYLPRGVPHRGWTGHEFSLHLTIGVTPYTWASLLTELISAGSLDAVDLRRSVAPSLARVADGDDVVDDTMQAMVGGLTHKVAETVRRHIEGIVVHRPDERGRLARMTECGGIEPETPVRLVGGTRPAVQVLGDRMTLSFRDRVLELPSFAEPQVNVLCGGGEVRAEELPSGIDLSGRLVLVRRLVREGLVEVVNV